MRPKIQSVRKSVSKYFERKQDERLSKTLLMNLPSVNEQQEKIFIFSSRRQLNFPRKFGFHPKIYSLIGFELAKRGYPSYYLFEDHILEPYFPRLIVNEKVLSCSIHEITPRVEYASQYFPIPSFMWDIERTEKKVAIDRFDFFPLIKCSIRTIQKRYNIDFTNPNSQYLLRAMANSCDMLLSYFRLLQEYANENRKKIRICGWESNYIPNGVFRMLCDQTESEADIQYVDLSRAYIHYFGEHARGANFISTANLTKKKIVDRKAITKSELDSVKISNENFKQISSSIEKALNKNFGRPQSDEKAKIIQLIEKYRSHGRSVFVLFGHLFYDVGIEDGSPSFSNMCEWITETINFFKEQNHLLLLKPHPVETKKSPCETLYSFSKPLIHSENVKNLNPLLFNIKELANYISCGLVWRSSVGLELTYLKVPNIIAGTPRYNILNLCYPKDKQEYFQLIKEFYKINFDEQTVRDVIRYIYFLEKYKSIEVKQVNSNGSWNKNFLPLYITREDSQLERLVDNILMESE